MDTDNDTNTSPVMEKFKAAFDALPPEADGPDICAFLATVALAYMPPDEAMRWLATAVTDIADYVRDVDARIERGDNTCTCPNCTARRAAKKPH